MVKKISDCAVELREKMRDGNGTVKLTNFITNEDLNNKGRMFGTIVLEPGVSIGWHIHDKDSELFYILKGKAKYSDNGKEVILSPGDITLTPVGTGHSIENIGDENVELIALIVFA